MGLPTLPEGPALPSPTTRHQPDQTNHGAVPRLRIKESSHADLVRLIPHRRQHRFHRSALFPFPGRRQQRRAVLERALQHAPARRKTPRHRRVDAASSRSATATGTRPTGAVNGKGASDMALQSKVDQTIIAHRLRGHLVAQLDPLGTPRPSWSTWLTSAWCRARTSPKPRWTRSSRPSTPSTSRACRCARCSSAFAARTRTTSASSSFRCTRRIAGAGCSTAWSRRENTTELLRRRAEADPPQADRGGDVRDRRWRRSSRR